MIRRIQKELEKVEDTKGIMSIYKSNKDRKWPPKNRTKGQTMNYKIP